jgi:hypothetical protein
MRGLLNPCVGYQPLACRPCDKKIPRNMKLLHPIKIVFALAFFSFACVCVADTKLVNGVRYGNVCRAGNVYSVRFDPEYWAPVGSACNVLTWEGRIFAKGRITHE